MDPKLSKNWRKAEPRLQDLPTANLGRISDPQVAIRPSSPAPEDAAVWLHPAAVLPAPQIANLWRAPEPEIATQRYLTYIKTSHAADNYIKDSTRRSWRGFQATHGSIQTYGRL